MADGYARKRQIFQDISGSVSIDTTTEEETPIDAKALETIFVQRVLVDIVIAGGAGDKWRITDTNGAVIMADLAADAVGHVPLDFGATGRALTEGEGLVISVDAGASGIVTWEGYRKLTGVGAA